MLTTSATMTFFIMYHSLWSVLARCQNFYTRTNLFRSFFLTRVGTTTQHFRSDLELHQTRWKSFWSACSCASVTPASVIVFP
jgi:hypothetical protein